MTGNLQARQLAEIIQRMQQRGLEMVNSEGVFVGRYDAYIAQTTHSADRMLRMGVDAWLGLGNQHFDLTTMFPNRHPAYMENALRGQYRELINGGTAGPEGYAAGPRRWVDARLGGRTGSRRATRLPPGSANSG